MKAKHLLSDLVDHHKKARQFFAGELALLKEAIPKIDEGRMGKASVLLVSAGQTGTALFVLAGEVTMFSGEVAMLARAFMEKVTNFCYVCVCDAEEFRRFELHPAYRYYHNIGLPMIEDTLGGNILDATDAKKEKQQKLRSIPVFEEALKVFSATQSRMNWTTRSLDKRIDVITASGKMLDIFFTICKNRYYSDASEALHGSLYGATYNVAVFDPEFNRADPEMLNKKLYYDSACILLHLGMLIHESISLMADFGEYGDVYERSHKNRIEALNQLFYLLGLDQKQRSADQGTQEQ